MCVCGCGCVCVCVCLCVGVWVWGCVLWPPRRGPRRVGDDDDDDDDDGGGDDDDCAGRSGEVVFSTGMVGYTESLTDPSYRGQLLASTFPMNGNYGVPNTNSKTGGARLDSLGLPRGFESNQIHAAAFITQVCRCAVRLGL